MARRIKKGRNIMIDIHMHTIYSDGDKTVEEVLKMCEAKKLEYISITDQDRKSTRLNSSHS